MRITNEADYALRIVQYLAGNMQKVNAKRIAEETGVSLRFSLKILRKLYLSGIVGSQQGANGGYFLQKRAEQIYIGEIIEIVDGPFRISHCLNEGFVCSQMGKQVDKCRLYQCFHTINEKMRSELYGVTIRELLDS